MAELQGWPEIFSGKTSDIDTSAVNTPGTIARDSAGNVYIYMQGVASLDATHNVVSYDENYVPSLIAAGAKGRVAVAMAVLNSATATFGWYQIFGKNTITGSDAVADNGVPYIDATAGRIDDAAVTGDCIQGMMIRSTDASSNVCTTELNYPFVNTKLG